MAVTGGRPANHRNGDGRRFKWTPTEDKILRILRDGMPHDRDEIFGCLHDELGKKSNVYTHISNIRRVLRSHGQDILNEIFDGCPNYRWIVLMEDQLAAKMLS